MIPATVHCSIHQLVGTLSRQKNTRKPMIKWHRLRSVLADAIKGPAMNEAIIKGASESYSLESLSESITKIGGRYLGTFRPRQGRRNPAMTPAVLEVLDQLRLLRRRRGGCMYNIQVKRQLRIFRNLQASQRRIAQRDLLSKIKQGSISLFYTLFRRKNDRYPPLPHANPRCHPQEHGRH